MRGQLRWATVDGRSRPWLIVQAEVLNDTAPTLWPCPSPSHPNKPDGLSPSDSTPTTPAFPTELGSDHPSALAQKGPARGADRHPPAVPARRHHPGNGDRPRHRSRDRPARKNPARPRAGAYTAMTENMPAAGSTADHRRRRTPPTDRSPQRRAERAGPPEQSIVTAVPAGGEPYMTLTDVPPVTRNPTSDESHAHPNGGPSATYCHSSWPSSP